MWIWFSWMRAQIDDETDTGSPPPPASPSAPPPPPPPDAAGGGGGGGADGEAGGGGLHVSANGLLFASAAARPGLLPRLLREILETRFMVKRAMKRVPAGSPLHRTLNSQQFALKLIANVTYGYASASFSGRMPNVHLADAIVQARLPPPSL